MRPDEDDVPAPPTVPPVRDPHVPTPPPPPVLPPGDDDDSQPPPMELPGRTGLPERV